MHSPRGRSLLFGCLYLSEGAPVGYLWWALPTQLRHAGVAVDDITALTALLVVPWTLKFFWAPIFDVLRFPRWGLRAWLVTVQLGMGLPLIALLVFPPGGDLTALTACLFVHAILAATQDVIVDNLAVRTVPPRERGRVNGLMQLGYLGGRAVFGGIALVIEADFGRETVVLGLLGCVWFSTLLVLFAGSEGPMTIGQGLVPRLRQFRHLIARALWTRTLWLGLAVALLAGAGFEAVGGVAGPMLSDYGMSQSGVGTFLSLVVVALAVGAVVAGWLSDRWERRRVLAGLVMGTAVWIWAVAALLRGVEWWGSPPFLWADTLRGVAGLVVLLPGLAGLYVLIGALTACSYAFFMDLTDPGLGGTQFTAFMAATNVCEVWSIAAVGRLIVGFGYPPSFAILAGASLLCLPALRLASSLNPRAAGSSPATL